jgi:primosomal protein N' (replication factor Y)
MYIVTVIPLAKGLLKENFSYFSSVEISLGSIVSVPIRSKNVDALVVNIKDARDLKSDLKRADYQLKKIEKIKGELPFMKDFFRACARMRNYTVGSTGTIIRNLIPSLFLENIFSLEKPDTYIEKISDENIKNEKLIFQAVREDRVSFYRTLIREAFAQKKSIFICVPTRYDTEQWKSALTKGIEQYVFTFHSDISKKTLTKSYNECITEKHPILIIGTGMFLSIPRQDIATIIIESESSDSYKQFAKPYLDIRSFAEVLSSINKAKFILADTLLRPETLYRHDTGELGEVSSPLFRLPNTRQQKVIDMKEEVNEKGIKKFTVLSTETKNVLEKAIDSGESIFLFSVRKGLAGVTVCNDCGHTLLCPDCATPVVLYGSKKKNEDKTPVSRVFMCNKCGRKEDTLISCPQCTSWNLTPLGVGTDRVCDELTSLLPKASIFQIDKEATPTEKEAKEMIAKFYKTKGAILVGTEMAFSYITDSVDHGVIVSLDGLLSIPSFNMTQKILHIVEKLHYITKDNLIIQTRIPENKILRHILSGNILPLYREDLEERKHFNYPPFARLIKITFAGTAQETEKARAFLEKILKNYEPQIFSAFVGKIRGQYITNTVIKIKPSNWKLPNKESDAVDMQLYENLKQLPPSFTINVDPEDLL